VSSRFPPIIIRNFWGKRFTRISVVIIVLTGLAVYFADRTDHSKLRIPGFMDKDTVATETVSDTAGER